MAPRMVELGFVGHTFNECDQMFRRHATEDNEVEVLPELVDTSDDDVQLPDLEEAFSPDNVYFQTAVYNETLPDVVAELTGRLLNE